MRYFIDTEYSWDDAKGQIFPISIGMVTEDGREFYGTYNLFPSFHCSDWVRENVLNPSVLFAETPTYREPHFPAFAGEMRDALLEFIGDDTPEFWGDYAAFDYVVLSFTMGSFSDWPPMWPMYVNDLQQIDSGNANSEYPHNALSDARAVRDGYCQWAEDH